MQLLRKNDARPSLHQPVRYQIVCSSCQPCLLDEIRLQSLYSLLIMWKVTIGPIYYRMSFYPSLYREDLIVVLLYSNIIFIPSVSPIRKTQYSESYIKTTSYFKKRLSGSVFLPWAYFKKKNQTLIVDTSKCRMFVRLIPVWSYKLFLSY